MAGERVLITGASLGIGACVARVLAARGAHVALQHAESIDSAMGHPGAAAALAQELSVHGQQATVIDAELGTPGVPARVVAQAEAKLGGVDVLVLCASAQVRQELAEVDATSFDLQCHVNLRATVEFLQAVLPGMRERRHGRVVSVGSVNQARPHPELMVYAALKAAQHNLMLGVAKQFAPFGVTANSVAPGLIETPRNEWRRQDITEWERIQREANPMGRAGHPEEVAELIALLVASAGAFITGADIAIDGGGRL
jgi:NAD(P)-dependent dehydrogenase (short-subunit alcohol dehydrogenase family)